MFWHLRMWRVSKQYSSVAWNQCSCRQVAFPVGVSLAVSKYGSINAVSISGWGQDAPVHDTLQAYCLAYATQMSVEVLIILAGCMLSPQAWCQVGWPEEGSLLWLAVCKAYAVIQAPGCSRACFQGFSGNAVDNGKRSFWGRDKWCQFGRSNWLPGVNWWRLGGIVPGDSAVVCGLSSLWPMSCSHLVVFL